MDRPLVLELARLLGSPTDKERSQNVMLRCPLWLMPGHPGRETTTALSVKVSPGEPSKANCHACGIGGTAESVLAEAHERLGGYEEALAFVRAHDTGGFAAALASLRTAPRTPAEAARRTVSAELERYVARCRRNGVPTFLVEQGYLRGDVERWGIGFDPDGGLRMRGTFPVHDEKNALVGVAGRSILAEGVDPPKWKDWPPEFARVKTAYFYGEHRVDATLEHVTLVEGPSSTVFAARVLPNVLGMFGAKTGCAAARLAKLRRWARAVTLMFDADQAGREAVYGWLDPRGRWHPGLREILRPHFIVRVAELPEGEDPRSAGAEAVLRAHRAAKYLLGA